MDVLRKKAYNEAITKKQGGNFMLISISLENFKSFHKLTTFNMIASNKLRNNKERIGYKNGISILKSAVIYGANASGKSNLVEAFRFIRECVLSTDGIPVKSRYLYCKNRKDNENKITTVEVRLSVNDRCYAYGFDVLLKDQMIENEWIMEFTDAIEPKILFKREKKHFELDKSLQLDDMDMAKFNVYADDLAENTSVLFLSEMNRNKRITSDSKLSFFKDIYGWFLNDLNIFLPETPVTNFEYYYDVESLDIVKKIIRTFDTGISDIIIKKITLDELKSKLNKNVYENIMETIQYRMIKENHKDFKLSMRSEDEFFNFFIHDNEEEPEITTLSFKHGSSTCNFDFDEESDGTRRIFDLLDVLLTKNKNSVYVIDEMERSLHPALTKRFIVLLNEFHKKNDIQLIFTTHEATIMSQELFRRDQIWFVARDNNNNSNLYPLDRFNERYDKKINKAYLEGRYGAIPVFTDFNIGELR
jgi:AAA15 family ATPase/GTPase